MVRALGSLGLLLVVGCEVADAPPLREDTRSERDVEVATATDTRVVDTAVADDEIADAADTRPETGDDATTIDIDQPDEETAETDVGGDADEVAEEVVEEVVVVDTIDDAVSAETVEDVAEVIGMEAVTTDVAAEVTEPCTATLRLTPTIASPHVATCSVIEYPENPPTSGPHYPIWAQYKSYLDPVPRGFYVHNLEHGAVVVAYHCDDCADEIAALEAMVLALPTDPLCSVGPARRIIITPDPLLPTRFAIIAWGASFTADCLAVPDFEAFIGAHYGKGAEASCADGVDVTVPGTGTYCPP